jgi:hypothetical protein
MIRRSLVSGDAGRIRRCPFGMHLDRSDEELYLVAADRLEPILLWMDRETGRITEDVSM